MKHDSAQDLKIFKRLLSEARSHWPHLLVILLLHLAAAPLALLNPVPLKIVVDNVLGSDPLPDVLALLIPDFASESSFQLLVVACVLQILVVFLNQLQSLGAYVLSTVAGESLILKLRKRLFDHVQRLSFAYHDSRGTSDSIYRIQWDATSIRQATLYGVIPFVASTITLISMLYVTFRLDRQMALIAVAVSPCLYLASRTFRLRMRPKYSDAKKIESRALHVVQEVLTAVRVVKAFGREEAEQERFSERSQEGVKAKVELSFAESVFGMVVNLVTAVGTATVLFLGVQRVQSGALSLGELIMILTYLGQLYAPLRTISQKMGSLQNSLASAQRVFELLDERPDVEQRSGALPLTRAVGEIEFQSVDFGYEEKKPVLRNLSFVIESGRRLGIAGPTGSGKTTLVSLLMRFYDVQSGRILLDGVDIRDYRLGDLRDQFALVLQEPVLFSATIAENIAYARPRAGREEIEEAARNANAHDFISALPDSYETEVGERGMQLSGGERQRVSLARAFLKDAPVLILDEPTSSVDVGTEAGIMSALTELMKGRTTLMIAHRLSTLEYCDEVIKIQNGTLAQVNRSHPVFDGQQ